jgi:pimeloyl-ACP methyl ester carboxylesterase
MREFFNRPTEQWALIQRQDKEIDSLAVFVHGFRGDYLATWGRLPDLIRDNGDNEAPFDSWDYLFTGYSTTAVETYLDIAARLETLLRRAAEGDRAFRRKYVRCALFGHSLGTLGIRQFLCTSVLNHQSVPAIHSVSLFGCPIDGSPLARFASFAFSIAQALKPENPQLRMLRMWSKCAHSSKPWPVVQLVVGGEDRVVGDKKAWFVDWPNDDIPKITNFDHGNLVKPVDWKTSDVVNFIAGALK